MSRSALANSHDAAANDQTDFYGGQAPGKSTRSEQLGAGSAAAHTLPFLDALLGGAPANTFNTFLRNQGNEFASFLNVDKDPATGLEPHQEWAVAQLVSQVSAAVSTWETQRGTPDLVFKHNQDVKLAFKAFRDLMIADPNYELLIREAGRRLKEGKLPEYAREIRMFNQVALIELKGLLGLEDLEPMHTYEFLPVWGASAGGELFGVKVGGTTKRILIRYTNNTIKGLSWTQQVTLNGFQLGFGTGFKANPGASASGPGDEWKPASGQPQLPYYAPDYFQDASFTSPSMSGSIQFGPASVKKGFGQTLRFEKGGQPLTFSMPMGSGILDDVEVEAGVNGELISDAAENNGMSLAPEAGFEAVNEFGDTSLDGDLKFERGEWPEVVNPKQDEDDPTWVPLHYARIFFETGSAQLDPQQDIATVMKVVAAIKAWDRKPDYRGSVFKVDISGCHSQQWSSYDEQLRALDERRDADGQLKPRDERREGDLLAKKEMENYELAMARARNTHAIFTAGLDRIEHQLVYGVLASSEVAAPTTHEPLSANPYGDRDEDRSATILVSYKIRSRDRQVNWNSDPVGFAI